MGKTRDLIQILLVVIIGVLIPFFGSIIINFDIDITKINNFVKIGSTFLWFLLIFGIELLVVFVYYQVTNKIADKKFKKIRPR